MDNQAPTAKKPVPLLSLVATALLYLLVALPMGMHAPGQGGTHLFLPAQGVALALVLLGGRPYAHAVAAGALLFGALAGFTPAVTLAQAMGVVVAEEAAAHGHAVALLREGRLGHAVAPQDVAVVRLRAVVRAEDGLELLRAELLVDRLVARHGAVLDDDPVRVRVLGDRDELVLGDEVVDERGVRERRGLL